MSFFRKITAKPWLATEGPEATGEETTGFSLPSEKLMLRGFCIIVVVLFSLFAVAYKMRMDLPDWRPLADPSLLWINTGVLVLASLVIQLAVSSARAGATGSVKIMLLLAWCFTIAFIVGQLAAWQQLDAAGYFARTNPANGFFYLLTGIHGLHVFGGLVALSNTTGRVMTGAEPEDMRLSIELCAFYWHFMFVVWAFVFWMLLST